MDAVDAGECLTDMFSVAVFDSILRLEKFYGAITSVMEPVCELFQCIVEAFAGVGIHLVNQLVRFQYVRKLDSLRFNIFSIIFVV